MTDILTILPLFIGTTELLLIGGMALLLFGGKKLPEMMRGLGQGVKEFKKGVNGMEEPLGQAPSGEAESPATSSRDKSEEKPSDVGE